MKLDVLSHLEQAAQACIHCGLCLQDCPTYLHLGNEMDSPRGRIYLMRGMAAGTIQPTGAVEHHLDLCLGCRACESACPSNVHYGELLEHAREVLHDGARRRPWSNRLLDWLMYDVLPDPRRLRRAVRLGLWARRTGLERLARAGGVLDRAAPWLSKLADLLPELADHHGTPPKSPMPAERAKFPRPKMLPTADLPEFARPPEGEGRRASVQYFTGCATSVLTPETLARGHRVLLHNGCTVSCPRAQVCCGAIHHHGGRSAEARDLARANIDAFSGDGSIVNIAAGCGAMLRSYGRILADDPGYAARAAEFSRRVRDISEVLVELTPVRPTNPLPLRVAYHDACHHAHAQAIRRQPRQVLSMIEGLTVLPCEESDMCCGAAGSYNLLQPQVAAALGQRKLAHLEATGARVAATGNIGCILHLRAVARRTASRLEVVHTIDLLHAAYGLPGSSPA